MPQEREGTFGLSAVRTVETFPFNDEVVSYFSQKPEGCTPSNRTLIFPGMGEYVSSNDMLITALVDRGEWVAKFAEPHGPGGMRNFLRRSGDVNEEAVLAGIMVQERVFGQGSVDYVAPSRGAAIAINAAYEHPEHVQSLTLINPAICLPDDTPFRLTTRYGLQALQSISLRRTDGEIARQLFAAPLKSISRGYSLIELLLPQKIAEIRKRGTPISIIFGKEDTLFPPNNSKNRVGEYVPLREATAISQGSVLFDRLQDQHAISVIQVEGGHYIGENTEEYAELLYQTMSTMRNELIRPVR